MGLVPSAECSRPLLVTRYSILVTCSGVAVPGRESGELAAGERGGYDWAAVPLSLVRPRRWFSLLR